MKYPVLKNFDTGDKIIIVNAKSTSNQGYFNTDKNWASDRGTLYHFVKNRLGSIFPLYADCSVYDNIATVLSDFLKTPVGVINVSIENSKKLIAGHRVKTFSLPELYEANYLPYIEFRGISQKVYSSKKFSGRIFESVSNNYRNVAFPYVNSEGKIIACEIRNKNWKSFAAGSSRQNAVWRSNFDSLTTSIALLESPIEALSYEQLKGKEQLGYAAFGGSISENQIHTFKKIIEDNFANDVEIICAFNNDKNGFYYAIQIKKYFKNAVDDFPVRKDFNEDLGSVATNLTQ